MIKRFLFVFLLCLSPAFAVNQRVISVTYSVDVNDTVVINDLGVLLGVVSESVAGNYSMSLYAGSNMLYSVSFDVLFSLPEVSASINISEFNLTDALMDEVISTIKLPFHASATSIKVLKGNVTLLDYPVSFCDQDGTCDPDENFFSCFWDCPSGGSDGLCDEAFDSVCDPDCVAQERIDRDPDCSCGDGVCDGVENSINCPSDCGAPVNDLLNLFYTVIGGVVALIAGVIFLIVFLVRRRKKKKKPKKLKKRNKRKKK